MKSNQNYKKVKINKLKQTKDSVYLFKNYKLVIEKKSNFSFTSDENTDGQMVRDRYFVKLNSVFGKLIFINDNLCLDCEELQLYKIK